VCVIGAGSNIGANFIKLNARNREFKLVATQKDFSSNIDIDLHKLYLGQDKLSFKVASKIRESDVIIFLAEPRAEKVTEKSGWNPRNITQVTRHMPEESILIYLSSSRIFNGRECRVSETQKTHPVDGYGKRKLDTEKIILESVRNYAIVRVSKVITEQDRLLKKLANIELEEDGISLMSRKCAGFTSLNQCSKMLTLLIHQNLTGILNFAPNKSMSYYDLGRGYLEANNRKFLGRLTPDESLPSRQHDCLENSSVFGPQRENLDSIWDGLNSLRL